MHMQEIGWAAVVKPTCGTLEKGNMLSKGASAVIFTEFENPREQNRCHKRHGHGLLREDKLLESS